MVNPEPNGTTGPKSIGNKMRGVIKVFWVEAWRRAADVEEVDDHTLRMAERKFERMSDEQLLKLVQNFESRTNNDGPE